MQTTIAPTIPQSNRPLFRFVVLLAGCFLAFLVMFHLWIAESAWFGNYLALNARVSAPIIRLFDADATAIVQSIRSSRFSLEIKHGCDALQPTAFFVIAMLSSPVAISFHSRLFPILVGIVALLMLNIVRIVTLFYAGLKFPRYMFEILHEDIWQAIFIFLPLIFWISWVLRVTRKPSESPNASP